MSRGKSDRKADGSGKSESASGHKSRHDISHTCGAPCSSFVFWELSDEYIEHVWVREADNVRNLDPIVGHGLWASEGQDHRPRVHYSNRSTTLL